MTDKYKELRDILEGDAVNSRCIVLNVDTTREIHARLTMIAQAKGVTLDYLFNEAARRMILRDAIRSDITAWIDGLDGAVIELTGEEKAWLNAPPVGREII